MSALRWEGPGSTHDASAGPLASALSLGILERKAQAAASQPAQPLEVLPGGAPEPVSYQLLLLVQGEKDFVFFQDC